MPFLKRPHPTARWQITEKLSQKNGVKRTIFDTDGNWFAGEWKDDMKHGFGLQYWKSENLYFNGRWENGIRKGFGTLSFYDDNDKKYHCIYGGMWNNDERNGFGSNYYSNGSMYEGDWLNNQRHGFGRMMYADGCKYEGGWLRDQRSNIGTMQYEDGNHFCGEWRRDKKWGEGHLDQKTDGVWYEGSFTNGQKNGSGTFLFENTGVQLEGVWVRDVPCCGVMEVVEPKDNPPVLARGIPQCTLLQPDEVIAETRAFYLEKATEQNLSLVSTEKMMME